MAPVVLNSTNCLLLGGCPKRGRACMYMYLIYMVLAQLTV